MMDRCYRPKNKKYKDYGGRGITVSKRWHDFAVFLNDMGEAPAGMSLDRKKNHLGYSKANCRWATQTEQTRNARSNKLVTYRGCTKPLAEWCEILQLPYFTIHSRLHKLTWSVEESFNTPIRGIT